MQPGGSLLHLQEPATYPYPEPDQSSPYHHIPLQKIYLNIILTPRSDLHYVTNSFSKKC
jgi:hypothetical protein